MKLSLNGVNLIHEFESLKLEAYLDGGGVWTIGWGHTGPDVYEGLTCTKEIADAWFIEDVSEAEVVVSHNVSYPINQNMFDALVSFEYNTGGLTKSTLLKKINEGDLVGAAREFPRWNKDNGKEIRGLTRRRLREQALFMQW